MNKISLSFDVEDWYHTPAISGSSFAKFNTLDDFFANWKGKIDCLSDGFDYLVDVLDKHEVTATFFIVADVIDRYPSVLAKLKNSRHEIQCHSLHHISAIDSKTKGNFQTPEEWEKELIEAKKILEKAFNKKIIGYRAPGAYFGNWMIDILERNGFEYDSSIAYNSIYNKTNVLLKNIPTSAYHINKQTLGPEKPDSNLVELPWSYCKFGALKLPLGGAFFYRALGNYFFYYGIEQCLKNGDTMFYMHPLDFSNEKIPMDSGIKRPAYWINKGNQTRTKFEKLLINYKSHFTTCGEVYNRYKNS